MNIRRSISVLAFTLAPLAVQAQSFDCRTARHADEYAICEPVGSHTPIRLEPSLVRRLLRPVGTS